MSAAPLPCRVGWIQPMFPLLFVTACAGPCAWDRCDDLIGTWEDRTTDTSFHFAESWSVANDSVIAGSGCGLARGDTVFKEELKLIRRGDRVIYAARVPDQNQGRWVEFTSVPSTDGSLIFENLAHDFPQRIVYATEGSGWHVTLTGEVKREKTEQHLHYVRNGGSAGS